MQTCIRADGIDLAETAERQTYQKLDLALDRLADDIVRISLYLVGANESSLEGIDKPCRLGVVACEQADSPFTQTWSIPTMV